MSKKLVVCVDVRDLRIAKTGSKTYLTELCHEFKKGHPDFTFYFIDTWLPVYTGHNKLLKVIEHIRFFFWKQVLLPMICVFRNCDILFCSDYFLPLCKLNFKTVVVFHDAFFWEYPDHYNKLWLKLLTFIGLPAARKSNAIITTTEYAKKQILRYTTLNKKKIYSIPLAPKSLPKPAFNQKMIAELQKKYILHIGVLEKRKNLVNLIKAFHLLLEDGFSDYSLILVGNITTKTTIDDSKNIHELIKSLKLEKKIICPGFIPDDELAFYYQNASVYAFVSMNEGFGIPILEAFENDLPVLVADNSCLPEVGGNAVITCNPFDEKDIKDKLKMILENIPLQEDMIRKGKERLALFSWKQTAYKLLEVFKEVHANS